MGSPNPQGSRLPEDQLPLKILINAHALINAHPQLGLEKWHFFLQFLEEYQDVINAHWRILVENDNLMSYVSDSFL